MSAVFGDLVSPARAHLQAATDAVAGVSGEEVDAAAWAMGRIARTLSRYLTDIAPLPVVDAVSNPGVYPQMRAAVDGREALRMAALTLRRATRQAGDIPAGNAHPAAAHLRAAGTGLAAGRDLLSSHFTTGPDRAQVPRSDWSAVITSVPVTRALIAEVADWARPLALLAARLALAAPAETGDRVPVQRGLAGACHWLLTASAALAAAQRDDPARGPDTSLLEAVPVAFTPPRSPPRNGEELAESAQGVADSAARLRAISWTSADQAAWSPAMTAQSWQWKATAAAVICHISGQILDALADSPAAGAVGLSEVAGLRAGAEAAGRAWERWRDVAAAWNDITTDTRGLTGPGIPDAGDLMVRLGRIAFTDPVWAPGRRHRGQIRGPDDLAPDAEGFRTVLAVVHRALDALAVTGAADEKAVGIAVRASRLHVPVRTLPETYDLPYRFGRAVPDVTAAVLDAYQVASETAARAAAEVGALVVTADAPSRVLEIARAAVAERADRARELAAREQVEAGETPPRRGAKSVAQGLPGPVEQALRRLRTADPVLILRARAIDRAGRAIIRDARTTERTSQQARTAGSRAARNAAGLAQQAFPHGRAGLLTLPQNPPLRSPKPPPNQGHNIVPGTDCRPR